MWQFQSTSERFLYQSFVHGVDFAPSLLSVLTWLMSVKLSIQFCIINDNACEFWLRFRELLYIPHWILSPAHVTDPVRCTMAFNAYSLFIDADFRPVMKAMHAAASTQRPRVQPRVGGEKSTSIADRHSLFKWRWRITRHPQTSHA